MKTIRYSLFLLSASCLWTISCGKSNSSTNPVEEKVGFDYADFLARNPVPADINYDEPNALDSDEYDPNSPQAEETLRQWDEVYEMAGMTTNIGVAPLSTRAKGCKQGSCSVWAFVDKATQRLSLYVDGVHVDTWLVSSGTGSKTPDFSTHPDGRIYDKYSSSKYPGGDYNGLGNMPYAVFISGGFAIHGTPKVNWPKLGMKASHGCIRLHPDNGFRFNRLVREVGVANTWISVD